MVAKRWIDHHCWRSPNLVNGLTSAERPELGGPTSSRLGAVDDFIDFGENERRPYCGYIGFLAKRAAAGDDLAVTDEICS